ncbi:hypothetical protein F4782DRAFT_223990 [Xylaria castorea]|nr:hypothetical protein F4782DRAFT_223990 [Xylaria castorea]
MKPSIEGQSNAGEIVPDGSTIDFVISMITESAIYAPEREDKGYAELGLHASQPSTQHQLMLKEMPVFWAKLRDMLIEVGLEQNIDKDAKTYGEYWALRVCRNIFTLRVQPERGVTFSSRTLFSTRAFLSEPGQIHPDSFLKGL